MYRLPVVVGVTHRISMLTVHFLYGYEKLKYLPRSPSREIEQKHSLNLILFQRANVLHQYPNDHQPRQQLVSLRVP